MADDTGCGEIRQLWWIEIQTTSLLVMYFVLQQKQQGLPEKKWGNYKLIKSFKTKPKQAFLQKVWHIRNNQNNNWPKNFRQPF